MIQVNLNSTFNSLRLYFVLKKFEVKYKGRKILMGKIEEEKNIEYNIIFIILNSFYLFSSNYIRD